jgi:hypothetical protein
MKPYGGSGDIAPSFLTSAVGEGDFKIYHHTVTKVHFGR